MKTIPNLTYTQIYVYYNNLLCHDEYNLLCPLHHPSHSHHRPHHHSQYHSHFHSNNRFHHHHFHLYQVKFLFCLETLESFDALFP